MKEIPIQNRKKEIVDFALVDDEDYENISQWVWISNGCGYARRSANKLKNLEPVRMHRYILNAKKGEEVDHINGNRLDNRKSNLRICSHAENGKNQTIQKNSFSGFKGVNWNKRAKKWKARVFVKGKEIHLGYFTDIIKAALSYDEAAKKYYGEFAKPNFPSFD